MMKDTLRENIYDELEKDFNIIYPQNENATYSSLLNYSVEKNTLRQRWYRYKEGFSVELIKNIIKEYNVFDQGTIMDPFLGSGTSIIAANELGLEGIGFEVNPFSSFLSNCKLTNYTNEEAIEFNNAYIDILDKVKTNETIPSHDLPILSIAKKVFHEEIQEYFMKIKYLINNYDGQESVKKLLLLGWLSSLELVSQYRKAGNGLKKKTSKKNLVDNQFLAEQIITEFYEKISSDIYNNNLNFNANIIQDSSLNMNKYIEKNSLNGVVFSPPYANSFDYTEIYKLELWFGDFVKEYKDLKELRNISLRSHLNGLSSNTKLKSLDVKTLPELDFLIDELSNKELWDKKIPIMLKLYFSEMFTLLTDIYKSLKQNGFCSIVVGNSSYGGVIFPTDLLLARFATTLGFKVDKILVDRYIITSSQQYKITFQEKRFLRESVVCLVKK